MNTKIQQDIKYFTTEHTCTSYRGVEIKEINGDSFVELYENRETNEWDIVDFWLVNEESSNDLLSRAKMYSKNISVRLNENSDQSLIDLFKRHNMRVKLQINFE